MSLSCYCCVLSGRSICVGLIIRPRESLPCVVCLIVIEEPHRGGIRPLRLSSHDKKNRFNIIFSSSMSSNCILSSRSNNI